MRILIVGGDGYLGWPTAMHFSQRGHDVTVIDNFFRRTAHLELGSDSLTPIAPLQERVRAWEEVSGKRIGMEIGDVTDWDFVAGIFKAFRPEAIVHYGEQCSAPYSMISRRHAVFTQVANITGTLNLLYAMADFAPQSHMVKLGTMGEYGTPNIDIEEGFIEITHNGRTDTLPFPKQPGSLYHLSKVHDSGNIAFLCRIWGLRCTDLNQGVVYGIETDETGMDERLKTRFDYDGIFGTAINRFCVQAIAGHPLTVYGEGGQTRGFLNVRDTLACVELATLNPAGANEYRVFNQFTEQFNVLELAQTVQGAAGEMGIKVEIEHLPNPRIEREQHYYNAKHQKLLDLGLQPHFLSDTLIESVLGEIRKHADRIRPESILPAVQWGKTSTDTPAPRARELEQAR